MTIEDMIRRGRSGHTPYPFNMTKEQWRHNCALEIYKKLLEGDHDCSYRELASDAYSFANAMIEEGGKDG